MAILGGIEDKIERSFKVGSGGKLTLETDRGSIEVKSREADAVEVEIIRRVKAWDQEGADKILEDFEIDFTQSGNDVHIRAGFKKDMDGFWRWVDGNRLQLHYMISVPTKYNLDLKTAGGSISVGDLEGEVRSRTSGGSLHFGRVQGPVWGRTSGGSITLSGCAGTVDVETSGGSINIGETSGDVVAHTSGGSVNIGRTKGSVVAKTSGGSITVEDATGKVEAATSGGSVRANISTQPQSDCCLETSGGSVTVHLPDTIAVDVDAKTSGGSVKTEFPVTVQGELSRSALTAKINGGGPKLLLRTSGGNIHLRKM
jgi:DUF4097 and DUF4098 domain-containing protein YvlB